MLSVPINSYTQVNKSTNYQIDNIIIKGNTTYSTRKLKSNLSLNKNGLLGNTNFTRRLIEMDRIALKTHYVKNGFLNCSVLDSFSISENMKVDVFFFIDEGNQFFLKDIEISGNTSILDKKLYGEINHKFDKPFNPLKIRKGLRNIKESYSNIGKPLVRISDSIAVNNNNVSLYLDIMEYPTMKINHILIKNNSKIKDIILQREIDIKPGEVYSGLKLNKSKKYLINTGLFSTVNINSANIDTSNGLIDLIVYVRERDMHYWEMNTGIVQKEGLGTEINTNYNIAAQWKHRNLWKRASSLGVNSEIDINAMNISSRPDINAEINYIEPWLLGFRSATLFKVFMNNLIQQQNEFTKIGSEISLIMNPDKRNYFKTGIEFSEIVNKYENVDTSITRELEKEKERAIIFNYRKDRRNDFLFPSKGYLFSLSGKIVGSVLGGTENYYQIESSYSKYQIIFGQVVLAYRTKIGFLTPYGSDENTPEYEKYYLGGATSLRGWENRKFIVKNSVEIRKNIKILTSFELRFPIYWRFGGEFFIDGGNLVDDLQSLYNEVYRWNYGFGITLTTPLGPARIDFAKPFNITHANKKWIPQFAISYAF